MKFAIPSAEPQPDCSSWTVPGMTSVGSADVTLGNVANSAEALRVDVGDVGIGPRTTDVVVPVVVRGVTFRA